MSTIEFGKHSEQEIATWFEQRQLCCTPIKAALEKVWAQPGNATRAAFLFGWNYGMARAFLAAFRISLHEEPVPHTWQKDLGIKPRGKEEKRPAFKERLKTKAHEIFPKYISSINKDTADATLIAEWLRRRINGG